MLSVVGGSRFVMTRWKLGLLVLVAAAALGVPTFYGAPLAGVLAGDDKGGSAAAGKSAEKSEAEYLPRSSPSELQILDVLDTPTNVSFQDIPLEEAMNVLKEQHSINIWIDKSALQEEGVDTSQPVSLNVQRVTVRSALRLMLDPLNSTFMPEDEVLKITSKAKADAACFTRTYPVRDLCPQPKDFEDLASAIQKTIEPTTWEKAGGQGSLVPVPGSGSLVILQSYDVHGKVLQLLRTLREAKQKGAK